MSADAPFARRRWIPLAAAAALVVAVGWIAIRRQGAPVGAPAVSASLPPPAVATTLTLTLGTSRAAGAARDVALPKLAPALELRIRLDPRDVFDAYSLELRSSSEQVVWRGEDLPASNEAGELALAATVPAGALADGSYELAVRGSNPGSAPEELGFVALKLRRTP
jgi:hypothetical protein